MDTGLTAELGKTRPGQAQSGRTRKDIALLGAFCLFLSAVEFMVPKPMPFLRLGLANLPLVMALDIFSFRSFLLLVCVKVFGQALVTGTLFSFVFLFSLAGTFLSALSMYGARRLLGAGRVSFIGIGTLGAMVSNVAQLALAFVLIFGQSALFIAPPFLAAGLVTGAALGLFCELFTRRSLWYAARLEAARERRL
ncbi:MAG: Gx transporter family protein [Spirochaetes bacterium]|nr:Gx transporter family protein [Spirochaetota bacterium]